MLNLSMPTRKIFLEKFGAEEFKDEMKTNLDLRHNYQKCQENLLSYKGKNLLEFFFTFFLNLIFFPKNRDVGEIWTIEIGKKAGLSRFSG